MRSEPRQILSLVRIPISPLRPFGTAQLKASDILDRHDLNVNFAIIIPLAIRPILTESLARTLAWRCCKNVLAIGNTLLYNAWASPKLAPSVIRKGSRTTDVAATGWVQLSR